MISSILFYIAASIILSLSHASSESGPTVELKNPKGSSIEGHVLKTDLGNDIYAFQDVPYAEPPTGKRRFQKPVLSKGWQGTIKATETKQLCLQQPIEWFDPPIFNYTEDCLFLSVYSPTKPYSTTKYPVLVWIHGGGFLYEGGVIYEFHPKYFIDEKIVMVTLNYRLGAMGFLTTGDDVIPANLGLHDQLLAIRWVHENIEVFGGDPSNIVIAGESAGGAAVSYHLLGPKPSPYYTGAIMQSGSSLCPFAFDPETYTAAVRFAQTLDPAFKAGNSSTLLEFLQRASEYEINRTVQALNGYSYVPSLGTGDDFAEYPAEAFDNGRTKRIPVLVGFNSEEEMVWFDDTESARRAALQTDALGSMDSKYNIKEGDRKVAFELLRSFYTKGNFSDDIPAFVRYSTDTGFLRGIFRSMRSYSKYVPETYMYQLAYNPSVSIQAPIKGVDGVGHAADLPLLFDQHRTSVNFTANDKLMSKRIVRIWANFVKYRNPKPYPEPLLENISWPKLTPNEMTYLNLTTSLSFGTNPRQCDKWANICDNYFQHPISVY